MTGNPDDHPDLSVRERQLGDRYLLCSDGLSDFVSADVIQEILAQGTATRMRPPTGSSRSPCARVPATTSPSCSRTSSTSTRRPTADTVPQVVGAAGKRMRRPHPRHPDQPRREGRRPDPRGDRRAEPTTSRRRSPRTAPGRAARRSCCALGVLHRRRDPRWRGVCRLAVVPAPVLRRQPTPGTSPSSEGSPRTSARSGSPTSSPRPTCSSPTCRRTCRPRSATRSRPATTPTPRSR